MDNDMGRRKRNQVLKMQLSNNARAVLEKRYLRKDDDGNVIETPEDMFLRVAKTVAMAEYNYGKAEDAWHWEEKFYDLMTSLDFLPNSPTLMNAGNTLGQLSGCFVVPVGDSMEEIFHAITCAALIHKSGGGTGFSFSRLRPKGDLVRSTGGVSSGPISFMKVFSSATDVVTQGGKRHGANMAIMSVYHPDIMEFIACKKDGISFTNFNISVAVDDRFMRCAVEGKDYDLVNPKDGSVVGSINARDVFDRVVEMAWRNGDPGLVFLDRINQHNPTPILGAIEATNPCGEQPLLPFESCNLGSINLSKFVLTESQNAPTGMFDELYCNKIHWGHLKEITELAVRFLDNVIDVNVYPVNEIEENTKRTRKIGLGVMGFADMLVSLKIPYDSEEAVVIAESVMSSVTEWAREASRQLALERGAFPAVEQSKYKDDPCRNACVTTIAPTGSLSLIANCSSGIEPLFALAFKRIGQAGMDMEEINSLLMESLVEKGLELSIDGRGRKIILDLVAGKKLSEMDGIPEDMRKIFVTAHEVSPGWHVRMQSVFQKHTENAVSKTINFPHGASVDDIRNAYLLAYQEGCKGITVYRDRSRDVQVLNVGRETASDGSDYKPYLSSRPNLTWGFTEKIVTGCGNLYITVNSDDEGDWCEVFTTLGKSGGCSAALLEAITRLISISLRSGVDIDWIIKHLKDIRCPSVSWDAGRPILSCPDAIATILEKHHLGRDNFPERIQKDRSTGISSDKFVNATCPDCGASLVMQEGCFFCGSCGYTKC